MSSTQMDTFKPVAFHRLVRSIQSRYTSLTTKVNELKTSAEEITPTQRTLLRNYISEINSKHIEFESNFHQALNYEGDDEVSEDDLTKYQDTISDMHNYLISAIDILIGDVENPGVIDSNPIRHPNVDNCKARLPKLDLIKFNGDFANWTTFINLFNATVHNNPTISNVLKLQYLLSVLTGEPLSLIRNLQISDANYNIAYGILTERYQNDRKLRLLHINRVIDLSPITTNNVAGIRQFVNTYRENVQALQAIQCEISESNDLLTALLLRKMDVNLRKRFESKRDLDDSVGHTMPSSAEIIEFLTRECDHHDDAIGFIDTHIKDLHLSKNRSRPNHQRDNNFKNVVASLTEPFVHQHACIMCNQKGHKIHACHKFLTITPQERFQIIKSHNHCVSCLGSHSSNACQSTKTCRTCHKRHNTLLHFPTNNSNQSSTLTINRTVKPTTTEVHAPTNVHSDSCNQAVTLSTQNSNHSKSTHNMVLLGTVLIKLKVDNGIAQTFRALIDSGSMCSLISERAVSLLNVPRQKSNVKILGINQRMSHTKGQIFGDIETLNGKPIVTNHTFVILDKLTIDLPRYPVSLQVIQLTKEYQLADPTYHLPQRIDLILGAAMFPLCFSGRQLSLGPNMPHLLDSPFGKIVMGITPCSPTNNVNPVRVNSLNICLLSTISDDLHDSIQRFWVQEDVPQHHMLSSEDIECEQLFVDTHSRDEAGRYIVRLPLKDRHKALGDSRPAAEQRLNAMERKFSKDTRFATLYQDFMSEYIALHHMSECDSLASDRAHYYLPHHGILKESSSTTKLRTVFDASCKSSSGVSLNDILMTGNKLQSNIADIIMQFRRHNVVICCDIKQMYRQILIHPDDKQLQLILWRSDPSQTIKTYTLNTVTYGVNSSPYLAIRTLQQLAVDEGHTYPNAAKALLHNTYVDDIITGADSITTAMELQTELQEILSRGGFELRKWVSNSQQVLNQLPESYLETPKFIAGSKDPHFTVLGLHWSPVTDNFTYHVPEFDTSRKCTKRTVLSNIASIYDPCGFLTPFILLAKCLMQLIWTIGICWDTRLPNDILSHWSRLVADTSCLTQLNIPRSLNLTASTHIELHGFCDASERGYAAVIYFRCQDKQQNITIRLISAKSRVAPLKKVSIPRLELCAAHLLSQMTSHIHKVFDKLINVNDIFLWSDSTITLNWIHTPPYRLKTFVANRVAQIQECISPERWNHVSSSDNPADCASRGLSMSQLVQHKLWWEGPSWLTLTSSSWPSNDFVKYNTEDIMELKPDPLPVFTTTTHEEWPLLTKYSSWFKLIRIIAILLRFIHNCRSPTHITGFITTSELNAAKLKLFFAVQQQTMKKDYEAIRQNQCPTRLLNLNPFIDAYNLIRVGGRLTKASIPSDVKHPIILPQRHHITTLLINYIHITNLHAGPQYVQSILVQSVWILNARHTIRAQLHKCVTCHRFRKLNTQPLMADLPSVRMMPAKPFASTGIDYAGPFLCKIVNLRSAKTFKVYISLFICMVTKAVHIEVVTDLTTEAFIAALTRFTSRRGLCRDIYCDRGTNFVGADATFKNIIKSTILNQNAQSQINDFASQSSIQFHFNPPAAPHFGGLWERTIQSIKYHLKRVIGFSVLTLPEFTTVTTRIEAILNSRPLSPMSSDPNDFQVLTPGHFLSGAPLTALPESNVTDISLNRLKHWQLVQKFTQLIWNKWSLEYLNTLQQRTKWKLKTRNFKVGDLVLLKTSKNPLDWPRARITEVFPGTDQIVRTVKIKTANSEYVRPTARLCLLPIY